MILQTLEIILVQLFYMTWEIYWGLAFGFILSGLVRAFVSTQTISSRLGKNNAKALGLSTFFGAISSSCSYAAASLGRTLLVKGSTWSNAVAFMVSSTNLVFEIFIVIVTLLGWPFFGGEIAGGLLFIIIAAVLVARFYPDKVKKDGEKHLVQSDGGDRHDHHHHHAHSHADEQHTMHPPPKKTVLKALVNKLAEASGHYYMDVTMVGKDIVIGLIIASVLMVLVPGSFWGALFLTHQTGVPHFVMLLWNDFIGVFIGIISFVCSVGNIVLATVFWHGGISFGGIIAFIMADLVTIPMLAVYRRYYGTKTMLALLLFLSISIIIAALLVDLGFDALGWIPKHPAGNYNMIQQTITWNYETMLNLLFIPLSVAFFFWGKRQGKMAM